MIRRITIGLAASLTILVVALGIGFAAFVAIAHEKPAPVPDADGIVALTGGAERVETALRLLEAGKAKLLLVSGVAHGAGLNDLARRADLDPLALAPRVTLGRTATTTLGNADETAEWAKDHGFHTLIIVTASYHMPRAMLEMRRAMPTMTLYPLPVEPQAILKKNQMRLFLTEYVKYIAALIGVSHVIRHPIAFVHRSPVGNSVNG